MVVVDVANVMGARPDGWWRDRAGAARRLCLRSRRSRAGPTGPPPEVASAWVLVLEGQAREAVALLADELNELDEGLDERDPGEPALVRLVSAPGIGRRRDRQPRRRRRRP